MHHFLKKVTQNYTNLFRDNAIRAFLLNYNPFYHPKCRINGGKSGPKVLKYLNRIN